MTSIRNWFMMSRELLCEFGSAIGGLSPLAVLIIILLLALWGALGVMGEFWGMMAR